MGCCGGGGGDGGSTRFEWNDQIAPYWQWFLPQAQQAAQINGYQPYTGQRIAPTNWDQDTAGQEIRNINTMTANPLPTVNAAMDQTRSTLEGNYLDGPGANPYSRGNQFANQSNSYIGDSPQFRSSVQSGMNDITNAYQRGTAADTTRMMNLSGIFGGGAHERAQADNEAALAHQLSDYVGNRYDAQWNRSGELEAGDLARRGGLTEGFLNRGSQNYENERGRQMGAIGLGNDQQGLALTRAGALSSVGDFTRGINQQQDDINYQDWQSARDWNRNQLGWLSGMFGTAQGGASLPATQTTTPGGGNWANGLGSMLAAYGMFRA